MSLPHALRGSTWLGPFVIDGVPHYVHRYGPDSAPHTLPMANSRRWDMMEADPEDPSRPKANDHCAMVVRPNDESDTVALRYLLGSDAGPGMTGASLRYKEGWGPDGALPLQVGSLRNLEAHLSGKVVAASSSGLAMRAQLQDREVRNVFTDRPTESDRQQIEFGKRNPIRRRSPSAPEVVYWQKPTNIDDSFRDVIARKAAAVKKP